MGTQKKTTTSDTEIPLPEPTIHHIQSFFDAKEAARSAVLSKSWYGAWLSRPNLDFNQKDFQTRCILDPVSPIADEFWIFVKKTVQRYEELNLNVESFKLQMVKSDSESLSLAKMLICKVLKMGVRVVHLDDSRRELVLPYEVLETETLVELSVKGLRICLPLGENVSCSKVKSLFLSDTRFGDDLFSGVFPYLEDLTIEDCCGFTALNCPNIKSLSLTHIYGFIGPLTIPRVRSLTLKCICIRGDWLSLSLPCLEDLTIESCDCMTEIQISSHSLKFINLLEIQGLRAKFDVASVRKFNVCGFYSPSKVPFVSFTAVSRECESNISLRIFGGRLKDPWCYQLRRFLRRLSLPKVDLSIKFVGQIYIYDEKLKGKRGPRPVVENLTLSHPSSSSACSDVLNGLLWSCRPKFITQIWFPRPSKQETMKASNEFIKLLCKELIHVPEDGCSQNQNVPVHRDLKDVNVEYFDMSLAEWRPLPWKNLLSGSESPKTEQKIRFQLEWCGK